MNTADKPTQKRNTQIPSLIWLLILVALMVAAFFWWRYTVKTQSNAKNAPTPLPVLLAPVMSADMPIYLQALGNVTPVNSVTVKTQINGLLLRVLFQEGQMVKKGELLAEIDQRPYQAQLIQYEGQLQRDKALLANARLDLERYEKLFKQDSISEQTLATQRSLVKQYEGNVEFDQGQIETVKVNLIYCKIVSPIDGRVGIRQVDPGNFIQTSDPNGIVIINTIQPITVVFPIPEDNLPQVIQQMAKKRHLSAEVYDRAQNKLLATGKLLMIDNQIDPTTGTVKLKAEFQNHNHMLFPNQFVNINLLVFTLVKVKIVPSAAIQRGNNGFFVYLLNSDQTVSARSVMVNASTKDNVAITADIMPGQRVVIEGADKLSDGVKVLVSQDHQVLGKDLTS